MAFVPLLVVATLWGCSTFWQSSPATVEQQTTLLGLRTAAMVACDLVTDDNLKSGEIIKSALDFAVLPALDAGDGRAAYEGLQKLKTINRYIIPAINILQLYVTQKQIIDTGTTYIQAIRHVAEGCNEGIALHLATLQEDTT